ncbi:MAG: hypothetical protein HY698_15555 [Deltaproteobacteria bacterium]|nr:hypothetical protein [Deltaproteobacteria bacterium]
MKRQALVRPLACVFLALLCERGASADVTDYLARAREGERLFKSGDLARSEAAYQEALLMRAALGERIQAVDGVVERIALVLRAQGRCNDRARVLREELLRAEKDSGAHSEQVTLELSLLAHLANARGEYVEALRLGERLLGILEPILSDRDLASPRTFLAFLYLAQGQVERGRELHAKSLKGRERRALSDPLGNAMLLANQAWVLAIRGEHSSAVGRFEEAVRAIERDVGVDHPNLASVLEGYAASLEQAGRKGAAQSARSRAKRAWRQARARVGCGAAR